MTAVFISGPMVYADNPVPLSKAVAVIQTLENRIKTAEWKVETHCATFADPADLRKLDFLPNLNKGWVVIEPLSGRYRVDLESVRPWQSGLAPYISGRRVYTFNGDVEREFKREIPGEKPPGPGGHPGLAIIRQGSTDIALKWGGDNGSGFFPPYFNRKKLSELLLKAQAENKSVEILEDSLGIWHIAMPDPQDAGGTLRLDYDPGKGGVVLGATLANGNPPGIWFRVVFDLQKVENEFWVPKVVQCVRVLSKFLDRIVYTDVKVNHAVKAKVFTQDFPIGAQVTDHIQKKVYLAGVKITDEQAAINSFRGSNGDIRDCCGGK